MSYSEDFWQGVVVGIGIWLLTLSAAVMKRRKQQQSAAKARKRAQEHDDRFL